MMRHFAKLHDNKPAICKWVGRPVKEIIKENRYIYNNKNSEGTLMVPNWST